MSTCTLVNVVVVYLFVLIRERERFNLFNGEVANDNDGEIKDNWPLSCTGLNLFEYLERGDYRNSLDTLK